MSSIQGLEEMQYALERELQQIAARAASGMEQIAAALEGWAKAEHSYQDRTSNLSNSIRGYIEEITPQVITVYLSAGMEYGVFLELARSGQWAFLAPVVERHEADILTILRAAMEGE